MKSTTVLTAAAALAVTALATPTPTIKQRGTFGRRAVASPAPSSIHNSTALYQQWDSVQSGLAADASELALAGEAFIDFVEALAPYGSPADIPSALASVASVYASHPTDFFANSLNLIEESLTPSPSDLIAFINEFGPFANSPLNINLRPSDKVIYPKAEADDAPYDVSEEELRAAIHIPDTFTYGQKQPVILVPGTGNYGGNTYAGNFIKLLTGVDYADPVWLNTPNALLGDLQVNAEYLAYAINYISGISNNENVTVITWSAGALNMRWAGKYWPSTRKIVNSHVSFSADYHGTVLAYALCPGFPTEPCDPAVLQQTYNSNYITQLRKNGGDSPYVSSTNIYSIFDEIVQPQENTQASAYATDAHNVGVTNIELQNVCYAQPAGGPYPHEGTLYNPIGVAAALDAIQHKSNAQLSRIDVASECQKVLADGLDFEDFLLTEATIPIAAALLLSYPDKVTTEPPIKAYAANY